MKNVEIIERIIRATMESPAANPISKLSLKVEFLYISVDLLSLNVKLSCASVILLSFTVELLYMSLVSYVSVSRTGGKLCENTGAQRENETLQMLNMDRMGI